MHPLRSIRRVILGAAVAGTAIGAVPAMASAASTCKYDPSTKTATVVTDGSGAASLVIGRSGSLIGVDSNQLCISSGFEFATVTNTDRIVVNEFVTDSHDGVTIDESNGEFAPGFTREADGHSEIEIVLSKAGGVATSGDLDIIGTPGNDVIRMATGAVSLQRDLQAGTNLDDDVDVRHPPGTVTVDARQGSDFLSGQGFGGLLPTLSFLRLGGGAGDDTLFGGTQGDLLGGGGDNDTLRSVDGASDFVSGGSGVDNAVHDAIDNLDAIESETTSSVGRLALAPRSVRARAGHTARLTMSWKHPKAWRELRTIQLRLYDRGEPVGTIAVRPGQSRVTARGAVKLTARGSQVTHSGKTVTARLAMRMPGSLAGHGLRVDVHATDRDGHRQFQPDAGFIRVAK